MLPVNKPGASNEAALRDAHKPVPGDPNPQPPACRALHLLQTDLSP